MSRFFPPSCRVVSFIIELGYCKSHAMHVIAANGDVMYTSSIHILVALLEQHRYGTNNPLAKTGAYPFRLRTFCSDACPLFKVDFAT